MRVKTSSLKTLPRLSVLAVLHDLREYRDLVSDEDSERFEPPASRSPAPQGHRFDSEPVPRVADRPYRASRVRACD
ncbi:hypothetical protein OOK13_28360 [Streptomyces sp. NBC_00378]|uniref:hypothetical protein n=1 Tax=unclassified Streptomyces TaxID=2593676 RepID=UPI0022565113|nr:MULTISPECIES: hypothetical protein [unclassified Streptomyces]MCX5112353.1 hypothetical protein [Streptomyces sp. NBC_00378]